MIYAFLSLTFFGFCCMAYLYFSTRSKLEAYKPILDLNHEIKQREQSLSEAQTEYEELKKNIDQLSQQLTLLNEDSHLASSGFYQIKYNIQKFCFCCLFKFISNQCSSPTLIYFCLSSVSCLNSSTFLHFNLVNFFEFRFLLK
jgi:cell division protein FtsB